MGFVGGDVKKGVWMSLNGGSVLKTEPGIDLSQVDIDKLFKESKLNSGGYGIIDLTYQDEKTAWAVGK